MLLSKNIIMANGQFSFDIVDMCDFTKHNGRTLYECLFTSENYAQETTAERNADKWIAAFNRASGRQKRVLCGYTRDAGSDDLLPLP